MKRWDWFLVFAIGAGLLSYEAYGETNEYDQEVRKKYGIPKESDKTLIHKEIRRAQKSKAKKKKAKKEMKEAGEKAASNAAKLPLLPDWPTPEFGVSFRPVFGFSTVSSSAGGATVRSTQTEAGLGFGVNNIPLVPSNPGFYISPHIEYAMGSNLVTEVNGVDSSADAQTFDRWFYGANMTTLYKFVKYELGLNYGSLNFDKSDSLEARETNQFGFVNDLGILVIPYFSAHYRLAGTKVYPETMDELNYDSIDHWIHGKLFASTMNFHLAFGPGFTATDYWTVPGDDDTMSSVFASYFKATTAFDIFWKLGFSGYSKYIISNDDEEFAGYLGRLPSENLNDAPENKALAADTLNTSIFFGLRDLIAGLGLGWRYNVLIVNSSNETTDEEDPKAFYRSSNIGLTFDYEFK